MFGQPELHKHIQRFKSLASSRYVAKLHAFDLDQTEEMLRFRWTVAGGKNFPFEKVAIQEIYRLTGGIAREICKLANESLLRGMVEKRKIIDVDIVAAAAAEAFEDVQ